MTTTFIDGETRIMTMSRRQAVLSLGAALLTLPGYARAAFAHAAPADARAFLDAVQRGDLAAVRRMLNALPALARAKDEQGRSAFVLAHLANRLEIAELILKSGIELDIVECVLAEDWERMEALAKADPDLCNAAHPIGGTPLHAAALVGDLDMWRQRSMGCEPDARPAGGSGFTAARTAMDARTLTAAMTAATDLLSNGSDVNAPQRGGDSVLHGAVRRRDTTLVRLAIRKGADVEARDEAGRRAVDLAAELKWKEGEALLEKHATLPRDNRASRFAFDAWRKPIKRPDLSDVPKEVQGRVTGNSHFNFEVVKKLVSEDERLVFSISNDDELAIEASAHVGNEPIMRYHLEHGAPLSLPTAVALGDRDFIRFLLDADPTLIHERGAHDFPVMYYTAIGTGDPDLAELLHTRGASVDQESHGNTTLHWCVLRNELDLARWLIDHGADIDAVGYKSSKSGETPLAMAQARKRTEMIKLLKDAGAKG